MTGMSVCEVYPRVCGGTFAAIARTLYGMGLSPRMRGNLLRAGVMQRPVGSIPAYAGEPPGRRGDRSAGMVYPRVCGGTIRAGRPE